MRRDGIEGEVLAQFVVDTLGHAEMSTFTLLRSTAPEFTNAVRVTLPVINFSPAEVSHRKVRQLVQMPFEFCLLGGSLGASRPDTSHDGRPVKVNVRICSG
jgi:protein TonB